MKKTVKVAVAVLIVGVVVMLAGFAMAGFDFGNLNTGGALVERTFEAEGDVTKVFVVEQGANVEIVPSADGQARVTCAENEAFCYDITEEDGVLRVEKRDLRGGTLGMYFGFWQEGTLTVEVPSGTLLDVETDSGDIRMTGDAEGLTYSIASLRSDNGDVYVENVRAGEGESLETSDAMGDVQLGDITVETDNGNIVVEGAQVRGLSAMTANGAVTLRDIRADGIFTTARNDAIHMEGIVTGTLTASTENDDIRFSGVEATESILLQTDKGDIRGELPGQMRDYHIESETDYDNSLPTLLDGEGIFLRAVTNNGDIDVTFAE